MRDLKQSALQIFRETLAAIDIPSSMQRKLCRAGSQILVNGERRTTWPRTSGFSRSPSAKPPWPWPRALADTLAPDFHAEGIVVSPSPTRRICQTDFAPSSQAIRFQTKGVLTAGARFSICSPARLKNLSFFFCFPAEARRWSNLPLDPRITLEDLQALNRVAGHLRRLDRRNQRRAKAFLRGEGRPHGRGRGLPRRKSRWA